MACPLPAFTGLRAEPIPDITVLRFQFTSFMSQSYKTAFTPIPRITALRRSSVSLWYTSLLQACSTRSALSHSFAPR